MGENGARGMLRGGLAWRQVLSEGIPTERLHFAGGEAFTVTASTILTNAFLMSAGATVKLGEATELSLAYAGETGAHVGHHTLRLELAVGF